MMPPPASHLLFWAFKFIQEDQGSSVYFRLSTKKLEQPIRKLTSSLKRQIVNGCYWYKKPNFKKGIVIICVGVIIAEVQKFIGSLENELNIGVMIVTSPDKIYQDWIKSIKNSR